MNGFFRRVMLISPLIVVGFLFQNFTALEVPQKPAMPQAEFGTTANSVNGAAEQFVRTQWMPELKNIEKRYSEKLQFRWDTARPEQGELEMNMLGALNGSTPSSESMRLSLVNDKVRLRFPGMDLACDYMPAKKLVTLRTQLRTSAQVQFEHSTHDQSSRLSWQMSW